jgi:hypothetical protein
MLHQIREMNRQRFGSRSERFADNPDQLSLFPLPEKQESSADEEEAVTVPEHHRLKKSKKDWKLLPREIEIIPVSDAERHCSCGCEKQLVRYEVKESLVLPRLCRHSHATFSH